jgi:hypothetical protein
MFEAAEVRFPGADLEVEIAPSVARRGGAAGSRFRKRAFFPGEPGQGSERQGEAAREEPFLNASG